jgi:hypothetical protein
MNLRYAPTTTAEGASQQYAMSTRLDGPWLVLARIVWIAVVALILAVFVASLPAFLAILHHGCTTAACHALIPVYSVKQLQAAGFPLTFYLTYFYAMLALFVLAFLTIGAVIFWLKSYDFMALYTSLTLVTFAMGFNSSALIGLVPAWWLPIQIIAFLGGVGFGTFFYLFPNGRFVPRWTRWLVVGWIVYSADVYFFPNSSLNNSWFTDLLFVSLLMSVLVAQVYRYRRISSHLERQQTKWVVFGMSIGLVGFLSVALLYWNNVLSLFQPSSLAGVITGTAVNVFLLLIPLSIAFAILRARLWDIDIIINRTLIYGMLTVSLGLVYFGLIFALQALLHGIINQNNAVAIVISTIAIFALFHPLRRRIQNIIDRRFYRRKYDAAKIVAIFSATLRQEVDLDTLREQLIAVVQETMQPAHISLWLRPPEPARRHTRLLPPIEEEGSHAP